MNEIEFSDQYSAIVDWLVKDGPRCNAVTDLLERFCLRVREAGIPLDRATVGVPLLHPIAQSSFVAWNTGEGASQRWFVWSPKNLEDLRASPIYVIYTEGTDVVIDLKDEADRARFPVGADLWEDGFCEYHAIALTFSDSSNKVFTAATKNENGFSDTQVASLRSLLPAFTLVFEGFVARKTAETLMETYVGQRAGLQVLDGQISRGDGSDIEAVIWFSDLRRFTELAAKLPENEMMDLLNRYFTTVTETIEENGGEVLKYIGDAVLAIFPVEEGIAKAVEKAEHAAITAINTHAAQKVDYEFGIGLHPGKVFYGNIGGGSRLDFTVIGAAVNLASRIEGLCGRLGEKLLVSEVFANHSNRSWKSTGAHELKGVAEPVEVFAIPNME